MAHESLKKTLFPTNIASTRLLIISHLGLFFFMNAIIAGFIFKHSFYYDTLALVAAIFLGFPIIYNACMDLSYDHFDMNELAALGVLASLATTEYFSASAISFFMIVSFYIEHRSTIGTQLSIDSLMQLTPAYANKISDHGDCVIHVKDLQIGDIVRVRPGDRIPADGIILSGISDIDQSLITGESNLIAKEIGDEVFGGTMNISGVMTIRILKIGEDTTIGKVKNLILQASQSKTPVERLITKYAKWYTPFILLLAGIVLFFTRDIQRSISMLVIACPCAILLSSPSAIVAALGAASRLGVFIKNVTDLEIARKVSAVVFDKTGTLTTGKLHVSDIMPMPQFTDNDLLIIAGALAQFSNHPVSRAIVKAVSNHYELPLVKDFQEIPGKGIQGIIDQSLFRMGRQQWLIQQGINIPNNVQSSENNSDIHMSQDNKWIGLIALKDSIRQDAAQTVDHILQTGISEVILITGDLKSIAQKTAETLHCTDVIAEALPNEKVHAVKQLQEKGHIVAVIGDGINDAPALAASDISIAMGRMASDVAIESASIALMNDHLNRIPYLFQLSKQTVTIIRQNILISIGCITIFLILSAAGFIHPILAAGLHSLNAIFVILNAARLIRSGETIDDYCIF